jgi:hypothetical protein
MSSSCRSMKARTLDWRVITPFHVSLTDLLCPL